MSALEEAMERLRTAPLDGDWLYRAAVAVLAAYDATAGETGVDELARLHGRIQHQIAHAQRRMDEGRNADYWRGCLVTACSLSFDAAADEAPKPVHQFRPEPGDSAICAICHRTVIVWCDGYDSDYELAAEPAPACPTCDDIGVVASKVHEGAEPCPDCCVAAGGATPDPAERVWRCISPGVARCWDTGSRYDLNHSGCGWVPSEEGTTPR